jgi:hypothetical protein
LPNYRSGLFLENESRQEKAMNAYVVSGLIKRRAELAGDIGKARKSLRRNTREGEFAT